MHQGRDAPAGQHLQGLPEEGRAKIVGPEDGGRDNDHAVQPTLWGLAHEAFGCSLGAFVRREALIAQQRPVFIQRKIERLLPVGMDRTEVDQLFDAAAQAGLDYIPVPATLTRCSSSQLSMRIEMEPAR